MKALGILVLVALPTGFTFIPALGAAIWRFSPW